MSAIADQILDAALALASENPWQSVTLTQIAGKADLPLQALAAEIQDKTDILILFSNRIDQHLLANFEAEPIEGSVHDRVFDALMRRFDLMEPHKKALTSMLEAGRMPPQDMARLAERLGQSQAWLMAGIGLEDHSGLGRIKRIGLAMIYLRTMRTWLKDDDPGLAKTMAALDRHLRDGASWLKRLETPAALIGAFSGLARGLWNERQAKRRKAAGPQDHSHDNPMPESPAHGD